MKPSCDDTPAEIPNKKDLDELYPATNRGDLCIAVVPSYIILSNEAKCYDSYIYVQVVLSHDSSKCHWLQL
jgi:hypothetical protein